MADAAEARAKTPFHGYYFRILDAQGSALPGLIAWPAQPELTGVMTFIVDQDGVVYEKSLGTGTSAAAAAIKRFSPDKTWSKVVAMPR